MELLLVVKGILEFSLPKFFGEDVKEMIQEVLRYKVK